MKLKHLWVEIFLIVSQVIKVTEYAYGIGNKM